MSIPNQEPSTPRPLILVLPIMVTISISTGSLVSLVLIDRLKNETDSRICNPVATNTDAKSRTFGMTEFIRLARGMNLFQVETILGRGTLLEMTDQTETYIWRNCDGSSISVKFQREGLILIHKTQKSL